MINPNSLTLGDRVRSPSGIPGTVTRKSTDFVSLMWDMDRVEHSFELDGDYKYLIRLTRIVLEVNPFDLDFVV